MFLSSISTEISKNTFLYYIFIFIIIAFLTSGNKNWTNCKFNVNRYTKIKQGYQNEKDSFGKRTNVFISREILSRYNSPLYARFRAVADLIG